MRGPELGLIFQEPMTRLDPLVTIEKHFKETLQAHEPELDKDEMRRRSLEALAGMGIPPTRFKQYPHEFSGGMRQRIMIALALVLRPKLVVADEPTTALDVIVEAQILGILADLRKNFDTALLLITHNLGIVAEACDRLAVMYAGRIVEEGDARKVFTDPGPSLHPRAASFDHLAAHHRASLHPGCAARPDRPAAGLPLPPPLPERDGRLRREGSGGRRPRRRPARRVLAARARGRDPARGQGAARARGDRAGGGGLMTEPTTRGAAARRSRPAHAASKACAGRAPRGRSARSSHASSASAISSRSSGSGRPPGSPPRDRAASRRPAGRRRPHLDRVALGADLIAFGQRGWKRQAGGGSIRSGGAPGM